MLRRFKEWARFLCVQKNVKIKRNGGDTMNYDAVIIGHSQIERISLSEERQKMAIEKQIEELEAGIQQVKLEIDGSRFTVNSWKRQRKVLEGVWKN